VAIIYLYLEPKDLKGVAIGGVYIIMDLKRKELMRFNQLKSYKLIMFIPNLKFMTDTIDVLG